MVNLLPPHYKKELQGEEQFRLVSIVGVLLMTFFVCLSLLLLSIRVLVSGEIQAQRILVESQRQEAGESRLQQMHELNSDIAGVSSFYANKVTLSDMIERISEKFPESVHITSFSYTKGKIALAGFAPRTEDLLQLQKSLEQDSLFGNFHFPPSNWINATNIDFSFDFEI